MKKFLVIVLSILLVCPLILSGCGESSSFYVAIDEVVWAENEVELMPGQYFDIDYKVYPTNATDKNLKLVDVDRGSFTSSLKWDKANYIDYAIIDEDTIQIVNFYNQTEFKLSIVYSTAEGEKTTTCKIKKREVPTTIEFEQDTYYVSTNQATKLVVMDNFGKELDLSKYKVTYDVLRSSNNARVSDAVKITDSGKGIIEAQKEGSYKINLKVEFAQSQDSNNNTIYKTLTTTCVINATKSYDKVWTRQDGTNIDYDGDRINGVKVISSTAEIEIRFFQENYGVRLNNCIFNISVVDGYNFDLSKIQKNTSSNGYKFLFSVTELPAQEQYILVTSPICSTSGQSFSQLFKLTNHA